MSPFERVFAVFALLLGLAVAEVLSGFARSLNLRHKVRVGGMTPLRHRRGDQRGVIRRATSRG